MKLSKDSRKLSKQLFRASFANGRLDVGIVKHLMQGIIESKPRQYITVLKAYQRMIRLEVEKHHAVVESAVALTPEEGNGLTQELKKQHGADLTAEFRVKPGLIGGVRIQIGSDVWDGTVQNRLARLAQEVAS